MAIEAIRSLPVSIFGCIDLLLLYRNLKLAIDVSVLTEDGEILKIVRETFSSLGFFYVETKGSRKYPNFYLAKSKKLAEEMKHVCENAGNEERLGTLSGYPRSAVDAFVYCIKNGFDEFSPRVLVNTYQHLPKEIWFRDYISFAQFRLSQKYWREEIKVPQKWASEIWRIAPDLYLSFVEVRYSMKKYSA